MGDDLRTQAPDTLQTAKATCDDGEHHYAARCRGGEPLWIPICTLCGDIGWADIREQLATTVLPAHRAEVLAEAAQMIIDHRDKHFPADGNDIQRRARRHLTIAVQVVSPPATREQIGEALVKMGVLERVATGPTEPLSATETAQDDSAVPVEAPEAHSGPQGDVAAWICPVHGQANVEHDGELDCCTAPGCGRTSDNELGCNCEEYDCDGACCGVGQCTCTRGSEATP